MKKIYELITPLSIGLLAGQMFGLWNDKIITDHKFGVCMLLIAVIFSERIFRIIFED